MICSPIIFTRTKYVDYRMIVCPSFIDDSTGLSEIENKITKLCSTAGSRGPLAGRRCHVLRAGEYVLFAVATAEFGRSDIGNRSIRGYYGIVFDREAFRSLDIIDIDWGWLDRRYVDAVFTGEDDLTLSVASDSELIKQLTPGADSLSSTARHVFRFNYNNNYVGVIGSQSVAEADSLRNLLHEAVECAFSNDDFELVAGVNNLQHAVDMGSLNAVAYDHPEDGLYDVQLRCMCDSRKVQNTAGRSRCCGRDWGWQRVLNFFKNMVNALFGHGQA